MTGGHQWSPNSDGPSRDSADSRAGHATNWFKHYRFIDWATQGYILLVGLIVLFTPQARVPLRPWLLLAHSGGLVLVHAIICWQARCPGSRVLGFLRLYYPILLYTGFYSETGWLNQVFFSGYLDPQLLRLEKRLLGCQPGLDLVEWLPYRWLAEVLYASYFSYYLMIAGVGLALLLRERKQFEHFISVVSVVFYVCYLTYIFLPVVGPRILCRDVVEFTMPADVVPSQAITTPPAVAASVFFQLMAWIYAHFETPGAAFPSSHVAVALTTVYFSFLYLRRIRWLHLAMALLLCVSTVYGRYHYVLDVVAGVATAALLVPLGNRLYARLGLNFQNRKAVPGDSSQLQRS